MTEVELRLTYSFAVLAIVGCGSSAPTDFHSPDNGGSDSGGNGGALQGGSSGAGQGGSAAPGGSASGGDGGTATAGASAGGSAGSIEGGAAGTGLGGTAAGEGAMGGSSGASTGARGGTGGSGTIAYACGTLMCIQGRQMCVHTLPAVSGGPHMYQCLEYPDNCTTVDCSCFCRGPQNDPCGAQSACMCSGDAGRITVQCGES